ncbi:CD209 antigen-like protein C [Patiria miniata]|uniref:C-type lectin domain-containing protein n=1 Tax=Patiria miniata TaxID=46514 RepID=A0A913ZD41_PATMI|nr:CD209 antigen-like protein C [Patiria miniata]
MFTVSRFGLVDAGKTSQERFGDSCYQLLTETFTWEEASQACANIDAGLVIPDSLQEHQFIWEMFTRKVTESGNLWIGCSDVKEEGRWVQAGDGDHECTYFNWAEGEPNPTYKHWEECAGMWGGNRGGFWNDFPCTYSYNAMCESPAVPSMSCRLTYDARGFFTAHCLTDRILKDSSTSSVAWALVCRDEPRCRSFSLRPASRGALMSCQLYPDTEMNTEYAKSCQYYYF